MRLAVWRAVLAAWVTGVLTALSAAQEPPALNPFGPPPEAREDAVPGYVEMSDGAVTCGQVHLTRDMRLKLYDKAAGREREIPLRVVRQIECIVEREWMEREWRFSELASDEKQYTGRAYPAREYRHTITLANGRTITGPLEAIVYVRKTAGPGVSPGETPADAQPERLFLRKRDKGKDGTDLKSLLYVKRVKLGEEALAEGLKKAKPAAGQPGKQATGR